MTLSAVQHERKPIIDKKDYSNNIGNNYNSNSVNKIFIRKDLSTDSPGLLPAPFNPCDLGLQFLNKRIGKWCAKNKQIILFFFNKIWHPKIMTPIIEFDGPVL